MLLSRPEKSGEFRGTRARGMVASVRHRLSKREQRRRGQSVEQPRRENDRIGQGLPRRTMRVRTRCAAWPQACYLNNPTKIAQVISANAINNVLWPQRATTPTMFRLLPITRIVSPGRARRPISVMGTNFTFPSGEEACCRSQKRLFPAIYRGECPAGAAAGGLTSKLKITTGI